MNVDLQQFVLASTALIGLVNGVNMAIEKDWGSFIKFMVAVSAGALFGYLRFFGLPSLEIGLALGLGSSGVYKLTQKMAGE